MKLILSEPGDEKHSEGLVQRNVQVVKKSQVMEFGVLSDMGFQAEPVELGAVASSGLEVSYEVASVHPVFGESVSYTHLTLPTKA